MSRRRRGGLPDRDDEIGQIIFIIGLLLVAVVVVVGELLK